MNNAITAYRAYLKEVNNMVELITTKLEDSETATIGSFEFWEESTRTVQRLYVRNNANGEILAMTDLDGLLLWEDIVDRAVRFWR